MQRDNVFGSEVAGKIHDFVMYHSVFIPANIDVTSLKLDKSHHAQNKNNTWT